MSQISETHIKNEVELQFAQLIDFAYLLGSAGTERFHHESDIDIAIFWKKIPEFSIITKMVSQLSEKFGSDVDLVSLNTADPIFSRQVLETGRLLVCYSEGIHLNWKINQLAQYPDFKISRRIIEENILNRKRYV